MVVDRDFELRFATTIIVSGSATSVESGFIDDRAFMTISFQWTIGFVPAVAGGVVWQGSVLCWSTFFGFVFLLCLFYCIYQ